MQNHGQLINTENQLKAKDERKDLFFTSLMIGACFLTIIFMAEIFSGLVSSLYHFFPELWNYDNGVVADALVYVFYAVICFALPAFLFAKITRVKISDRVSFARPKKGTGIPAFFVTVGLIPIANYIANFVVNIFNSYDLNPTDGVGEIIPLTIPGMVLYTVQIAVIPALCEEILCRGYMFGSLRKYGEHSAIIFSAVIFALFHKNFQQIPFALILGVVFAYSLSICDSIWIPVLAHFFNNFGSCMLYIISPHVSVNVYNIISVLYMLTLTVLGCIGIIWIATKAGKGKVSVPKYNGVLSAAERNILMYISPSVFVFIILMLYMAIENMK